MVSREGAKTSEISRKGTVLHKASDQVSQYSHIGLLLLFSAAQAWHNPAENKGPLIAQLKTEKFQLTSSGISPDMGLSAPASYPVCCARGYVV